MPGYSYCNTKLIYTLNHNPSMFDSISSVLQISIRPEAFGVWIPLATGLVIGLVYAIASGARKAR
jgi:hypothetical protein